MAGRPSFVAASSWQEFCDVFSSYCAIFAFILRRHTWFARIPALLELLAEESTPSELTRRDLERLLGVRRRRAILVLHRCRAVRRGTELVASREAVIAYLQQCWDDEAAERAAQQERQVFAALSEARRALMLPRISLPPSAQLSAITFAGLPSGIELRRDELRVRFSSAQELVEQLFTLAQAFANDYESLEQALSEKGAADGRPFGDRTVRTDV